MFMLGLIRVIFGKVKFHALFGITDVATEEVEKRGVVRQLLLMHFTLQILFLKIHCLEEMLASM